jgi:hypothetical protein
MTKPAEHHPEPPWPIEWQEMVPKSDLATTESKLSIAVAALERIEANGDAHDAPVARDALARLAEEDS